MPHHGPNTRLRLKLHEAVRDLLLRDETENTARVLDTFVDILRAAPAFASSDANRWRRTILTLVAPSDTETVVSHPAGARHFHVLRLTREDKQMLRSAIWSLHGYLMQAEG